MVKKNMYFEKKLDLQIQDFFIEEKIPIPKNIVKRSEELLPNHSYINQGIHSRFESIEDLPIDHPDYRKADKVKSRLKGKRHHAQILIQIQLFLYGEVRPNIVEKNDYDFLDQEKQIIAESGNLSSSIYHRFPKFLQYQDKPTEWVMYHKGYGKTMIKYTPTKEFSSNI